MSRPSARMFDQMRDVRIERQFTKHAEGSVLISFGDTRVLCTASIENKAPGFLRGKGEGWVTAEYGMLPRNPRASWSIKSGEPLTSSSRGRHP